MRFLLSKRFEKNQKELFKITYFFYYCNYK